MLSNDEHVTLTTKPRPLNILQHTRAAIRSSTENGTIPNQNIYQLRRSYVREKKDGLCPTLTANMGIGGHNVPFIRDEWGIRRLGVDEVARLQGFNDPHDLFPADITVTERYRLLGNAVCADLATLAARRCLAGFTECCSAFNKGDHRD